MNDWQERQDLVRNCKGAAASIMFLLLLADGRSLTSAELQQGTAYTDKPVTDALAYLEPRGIVQYNGHYDGWSLTVGARQLDFINLLMGSLKALPTPAPSLVSGSHGSVGSHGPTREFAESSHGDSWQVADKEPADVGNIPTSEDRNISDLEREGDVDDPHVCMFKHKHVFKNKNIHTKHDDRDRNISELADVLALVGIRGRNLETLSRRDDLPAAWPLAWWLDLQSQPWQPKNPGGWIYIRLNEGREPKREHLAAALAHLQECGDVLELPQDGKQADGLCPDCGEKLYSSSCLYCSGVIKR